jgi:hypothetical protein
MPGDLRVTVSGVDEGHDQLAASYRELLGPLAKGLQLVADPTQLVTQTLGST